MKKGVAILAIIFAAFCLCYGAYEEGRFRQRWDDVRLDSVVEVAAEKPLDVAIVVDGINGQKIEMDNCHGWRISPRWMTDNDSVIGKNDTIRFYHKDGSIEVVTKYPFRDTTYLARPEYSSDTYRIASEDSPSVHKSKKHHVKRDKWGHILRDRSYIGIHSGDVVFPDDQQGASIGTGFWSKSVDPSDWPFPGRDGLAYAQFTWDEGIWSDGKSHNGENFDSVFNVLHNQLVKTWWDSLMSPEYIDTISGFLLIKACDDSFPTSKIHYYWDSIMYNTKTHKQ